MIRMEEAERIKIKNKAFTKKETQAIMKTTKPIA